MPDHIGRLRTARIARLSTLDGEGHPNVLPVCFVVDGDRTIYTAVDGKPKKAAPDQLARVRNIQRHGRVALVVDHYEEDWRQLWYVLVRGVAALIPGEPAEERARSLTLLREKYPQYRAGLLADEAPIIRISIERITGWESKAG
ncbi:MAG TPA: TIGR03668 family PPOX class F420-dependent oxidoreductase [Burkholderiales bacterium]|nr:TIGR03668 family PPOX class F420-dependent oxidoreductase [Burkholderiales bacterium]